MRPEDQRPGAPRYTVEARTLIFLTRGNRLLLLRGSPTKRLWAGKHNGIGGHLEPGESPIQSARRELREEVGLTAPELALRALVHVTLPEPPGVLLFVFAGEAGPGEPVPSEEGTPVWIPLDAGVEQAISALPLVEDLPELLPRVLEPVSRDSPPGEAAVNDLIYATYVVTEKGLQMTFA